MGEKQDCITDAPKPPRLPWRRASCQAGLDLRSSALLRAAQPAAREPAASEGKDCIKDVLNSALATVEEGPLLGAIDQTSLVFVNVPVGASQTQAPNLQRAPELVLCAGGGVALLYASRGLDSLKEKLTNFDQQVGVQIVQNALKVPLKTIADNAGALSLGARCALLLRFAQPLPCSSSSSAACTALCHKQRKQS